MIAVVGLAIRAPGAPTVDAFWERVAAGANCSEQFIGRSDDLSALDQRLFEHGTRVEAGGVLDGVEDFDPAYFGLSRLDAAILDPQQRIFLELARHALDDAAAPEARNEATAVFAGCGMSSYLQNNLLPDLDLVERAGAYPLMLGNDKDFLATRVSYKLGLGGPSMTVQTACSTSLVAVHQAAQSLLAGECDAALAGGVTIRVPERRGYLYQPDGIMAPDGVCRPFDARAGGFVPANGGVAIVLRRLEDALADGDPIRAVLLASAVNNDGAARSGFTAPGVEGQVRVLSEALALSGLQANDITHVETHGTATALGDAVEFAALQRVYGAADAPCHLGAAKANFGHTDTAAGGLGLAKAILALQHRQIPAVANFSAPNPRLEIEGTRFTVPTTLTEWGSPAAPRRAAVTSLGLGGTNAHVIVEEAPPRPQPVRRPAVVAISAHSAAAARERAAQFERVLAAAPERVAGLAAALAASGNRFPYRAVVELGRAAVVRAAAERMPVAFAFPGGGAQHPEMARALSAAETAFADALDAALALVDDAIREVVLHPGADAAELLRRPAIGLPALFCMQLATWRLFEAWGVTPAAVIGHSSGEYVAACVAGVLEPGEAARLVTTRARLFETAPKGAMVSVPVPEARAGEYLAVAEGLEIAAINGAADTVIGGPLGAIELLEAELARRGEPAQRVHVDVAAHTASVVGVANALERVTADIPARPPTLTWMSNLSGRPITREEIGPGYWGAHLRRTVRFADGIRALVAEPGVVLDMGPGQVLKASLERDGVPDGVLAVAALPHPRNPESPALHVRRAVATLWTAGVGVGASALRPDPRVPREPLPPYPFERTRCWVDPPAVSGARHRLYESALEPCDEPATGPERAWHVIADGSAFAADALERLRAGGGVLDGQPADGHVLVLSGGGEPKAAYHALAAAARELHPRELVSLTEAGDPVGGLCAGLIGVIRNEYPGVVARAIEVSPGKHEPIARELRAADGRDVVLRDGRRWARTLRRLPDAAPARPAWRDEGVWVITGGLGAIGRSLAVHLARTVRARVVLVARSRAGAEAPLREAALEAITAAGGAFELVLGDIADPAVARAAVERAEKVYGRLDGVIHAAGVPAGGVLELRDEADAEAVLRPKLDGLHSLLAALADRELDTLILCSALDAVLGTPGQAEHCAANAYFDAWAREVPARRALSIGWSAWHGIGQAARAVVPEALRAWREHVMAAALTPDEGCAIFDAAVLADRPYVLVSSGDPQALQREAAQANPAPASRTDAVIDESLDGPVERAVAELWVEVLAAPRVLAGDDFFALGGHSLAAMRLVARLRELFDVPVTLPALLQRPLLLDQVALVEELLLDAVEELDDEEVARRLG